MQDYLADREQISIHSPHARGDHLSPSPLLVEQISIHSPHARGDLPISLPSISAFGFQSTPLMRGET